MTINTISPATFTTSILIGDPAYTNNAGHDSIPLLTFQNGSPVSAALEIQSNDAAILFPRMTTVQRNAIPNPANGMMVFNNDTQTFDVYSANVWAQIGGGGGGGAPASATYILQTPNLALTNAQALSVLATGILKSTTATGVVSTAVPGTDYYAPGFPLFLRDDNDNMFVGNPINNSAQTGTNNLGIGNLALNLLTNGSDNTGIGFGALNHLTNAVGNTCVGTYSGINIVTGSQNSSFGFGALQSIPGGNPSFNCAFGVTALFIATGNHNSSFGWQSGQDVTTGAFNCFFGSISAQELTTGINNCAYGYASLNKITNQDNNAAFGFETLVSATNSVGTTAIGASAGALGTQYTNCTFLGFNADASVDHLTNACAIGANASVAQNNAIILGNGANVGIGTSTPNTSSILDLSSTTGSLLIPRMTTGQQNALTGVNGMIIYNSTTSSFNGYNSGWVPFATGTATNWVDQTTTPVTMAVNTSYVADNAGLVTLTLPAVCAFGSMFSVIGKGAGGWHISQNAGQTIHLGNTPTTVGVGGSLASTNAFDCVTFVCVTANTTFVAYSSVGTITVV